MKKDFLYRTADIIWERFVKKDKSGTWYADQVKEDLERLYPYEGKKREKVYYIEKIRLSLILCLAGFFLAVCLAMTALLQPVVKENRITREKYEGGEKNIPVEVVTGGEKRYEFSLNVRERKYSQDQLKELYENAKRELEQVILNQNESLQHVESDLMLVEKLPEYPFQIEWESGNYNVIDAEGKIRETVVPETGEQVSLNAIFTYEDFRAEYLFFIQIFPKTLTEEEKKEQRLIEAAERAEEESREDETFLLPTESDGEILLWQEQRNAKWLVTFFGALCTAVLVYFLKDKDLKKEIKKREKQMLLTYPEMVSKLSIYLGAGMTLKSAWIKICTDYKLGKSEEEKNAVYEEMSIACQEMKSGMPEDKAYELFGRRCGLQLYSKFSSMLIQNLRKGSTKLVPLLKEESRLAFEERKNAARKAGEEAGMKLLMPMVMMLCIVMIMILLPAFMSF